MRAEKGLSATWRPDPGERELQERPAERVVEDSRPQVADLDGAIQGRRFPATASAPDPADARRRCGSCDFEHTCSLSLKQDVLSGRRQHLLRAPVRHGVGVRG